MKHQDVQVVSAGTFVLTAADQGAGAILPKTVMIPDLHRVATVSGPKGWRWGYKCIQVNHSQMQSPFQAELDGIGRKKARSPNNWKIHVVVSLVRLVKKYAHVKDIYCIYIYTYVYIYVYTLHIHIRS